MISTLFALFGGVSLYAQSCPTQFSGTTFQPKTGVTSANYNIDQIRLEEAIEYASQIMEGAGVSRPFIRGMYNGGHLGGTVPLKKEYVKDMKPSWLPEGLWVADLSLAPRSQGMPTILLTAALALRVARMIIEEI